MTKKFTSEESCAKIKAIISKYFEDIGRENIDDSEETKQELIDDIDEILNSTNISQRHLIVEKLQLDEEYNKFKQKNGKN